MAMLRRDRRHIRSLLGTLSKFVDRFLRQPLCRRDLEVVLDLSA
jgi:hypothetical protein